MEKPADERMRPEDATGWNDDDRPTDIKVGSLLAPCMRAPRLRRERHLFVRSPLNNSATAWRSASYAQSRGQYRSTFIKPRRQNPCCSLKCPHGPAMPPSLDLRRARRLFRRPDVPLLRPPQSSWRQVLQRLCFAAAPEAVQPM